MVRPKISDYILASVIILAAVLLLFYGFSNKSDSLTAVVTVDGKEIQRVLLTGLREDITITVKNNGYTDKILFQDGSARVLSADCPDQICVNTGVLTRPGMAAVCLKTGMILRITGGNSEKDDGIDAYVR